jgi:hypothetical protein
LEGLGAVLHGAQLAVDGNLRHFVDRRDGIVGFFVGDPAGGVLDPLEPQLEGRVDRTRLHAERVAGDGDEDAFAFAFHNDLAVARPEGAIDQHHLALALDLARHANGLER